MGFALPGVLAGAGFPGFQTGAVEYDGTNDMLKRTGAMTGASDSVTGTFSCWIKANSGMDATLERFFTLSTTASNWRMIILKSGSNLFTAHARTAGGTQILQLTTTASRDSTDGWYHLLFSWNLVSTPVAWAVVDGTEGHTEPILSAGTCSYTRSGDDWWAGAEEGSTKLNGCFCQVYFHDVYFDLGTQSNIDKFILNGKPVDLGDDGSTPSGSQPIVYLKDGDSVNSGTGEDYTLTGSTPDCETTPTGGTGDPPEDPPTDVRAFSVTSDQGQHNWHTLAVNDGYNGTDDLALTLTYTADQFGTTTGTPLATSGVFPNNGGNTSITIITNSGVDLVGKGGSGGTGRDGDEEGTPQAGTAGGEGQDCIYLSPALLDSIPVVITNNGTIASGGGGGGGAGGEIEGFGSGGGGGGGANAGIKGSAGGGDDGVVGGLTTGGAGGAGFLGGPTGGAGGNRGVNGAAGGGGGGFSAGGSGGVDGEAIDKNGHTDVTVGGSGTVFGGQS